MWKFGSEMVSENLFVLESVLVLESDLGFDLVFALPFE